MKEETVDVVGLFNQAWVELYCPPVRLTLKQKEKSKRRPRISAVNGTVRLRPNIVPLGCDPKKYLLWFFRHELSHVHYCPYDVKTAYSLEKAAYEIAGDWSIAYLATHIFSDVQIDLNYLPRRFGELPYLVRVIGKKPKTLLEQIMQEIYLCVHPTVESENRDVAEAAKEIVIISLLDRTWHTKVQMIAHVLDRLKRMNPKSLSDRKMKEYIDQNPLHVREDFLHSSVERFAETYGSISDEEAAKAFYEQWIETRLSPEETEKIKEMIEEKIKTGQGKGEKQKGKGIEPAKGLPDLDRGGSGRRSVSGKASTKNLFGSEPHLPTSISKPYKKIKSPVVDELLWKRYWYRSRAKKTIIQYISASRSRRPVWSVMKYPDEWYIEDEIEDLDIETSMDEGPLIPEVTTLKWVEEPTPHGQSIISGFVPSAVTVLDASLSMSNIRNEAAVAAFIAHLSAQRAGGQTATIAFSTGYISAGWEAPEEMKELTLAMNFGEFTVFPSHEISRLISGNRGPCFIVVITDRGWQNVDEAVSALRRISDSGHKIIIFLLKGGEYPDRIELIKRTPDLRLYKITDPETDLQGLVLSESMKTYKIFLT